MHNYVIQSYKLNDHAILKMINAAIDKSKELGVAQCIVIVDSSGETLAKFRMDGAKFLSLKSATTKARTAASIRTSSGNIPDNVKLAIALATQNHVTGLAGGLPILFDGHCVGGIGVGSGSAEQDVLVAQAAINAISE